MTPGGVASGFLRLDVWKTSAPLNVHRLPLLLFISFCFNFPNSREVFVLVCGLFRSGEFQRTGGWGGVGGFERGAIRALRFKFSTRVFPFIRFFLFWVVFRKRISSRV